MVRIFSMADGQPEVRPNKVREPQSPALQNGHEPQVALRLLEVGETLAQTPQKPPPPLWF